MTGVLALAIETATADTEVALADEDGPLAEVAVRRGRRHVENVHPAIVRVCEDAGVTLAALTAIGVDVGPGLFTGLRVGVTAAKTLAFVLGVPLVACTSLETLAAAAAPFVSVGTLVVPVVDMRRGEVAWSIDGPPQLGPPAALAAALEALLAGESETDVLLVGDGAAAHGAAVLEATTAATCARVEVAGTALTAPPARVLAALAVERADAGSTVAPEACVPLYLREADAAVNWESRPGRPATPVIAQGRR